MNCTRIVSGPWGGLTTGLLFLGTIALSAASPASAARMGADSLPNVPLVNQDGKTVHFYDDVIKGKVVTIDFMFTSYGDSCPLETVKLRQVQQLLGEHAGKDVYMYSISVDPNATLRRCSKLTWRNFTSILAGSS